MSKENSQIKLRYNSNFAFAFDNDEKQKLPKNLNETLQYIENTNIGISKHDFFNIHVLYF